MYERYCEEPYIAPLSKDLPFKALNDWNDHLIRVSELERLFPKKYPPLHKSPSPPREIKYPSSLYDIPMANAYGYNYAGQPSYLRNRPLTIPRRPLRELFNPNTSMPISRFTRDPWWWEYPELRPYEPPTYRYKPSPFYLRDSYLSPVKRTYLWGNGGHHPIRPFSAHY